MHCPVTAEQEIGLDSPVTSIARSASISDYLLDSFVDADAIIFVNGDEIVGVGDLRYFGIAPQM